jgi:hypothetical protein
LGLLQVWGRNRVPSPATGKMISIVSSVNACGGLPRPTSGAASVYLAKSIRPCLATGTA